MSFHGQTDESQAQYNLGAAAGTSTEKQIHLGTVNPESISVSHAPSIGLVQNSEETIDIHICGSCKLTFNDVDLFITHKRHGCSVLSNSSSVGVITSSTSSAPMVSVTSSSNSLPFQNASLINSQSSADTIQNQPLATVNVSRISDLGLSISHTFSLAPDSSAQLMQQSSPSVSSTQMVKSLTNNKSLKSRGAPVKKFKCETSGCSYVSAYQKDLERHMRTHTGERPFECILCGKTFNRSDKLKIHLRWHSGDKPYKCSQCTYSTGDSSSLKKHLRIHSDERPFRCQICSYASRNSSQLVVHLRTHTGDAPFMCHLCNAKFKINSDLKRHVRMHTGEKPFKCELCNYCCAIKGNLKTHLRINHSSENHLKCDRCDFSSPSRKLFRDHIKTHDVKPVKCFECSYTCKTKAALRNHRRVHCDIRPFKCEYCMYCSRQSGNVRTHVKKRHPEKLKSKKRQHKSSQTKEEVEIKEDDITIKKGKGRPFCQKAFKCELCDAAFVRDDSFRSHMRQHRELAQTHENLALAVLQLQNPININSSSVSSSSDSNPVVSSHQGDAITIVKVPIEQTNEVIGQAMQQSGIMPMTQENEASATSSTSNLNNHEQSSYTQSSTSVLQQYAQSAKNIAYVQNQCNMAIEANNHNATIAALQAALSNQAQTNVTALSSQSLSNSQAATLQQQGVNIQPQMMYRVQPGVNILGNLQLPFLSVNSNQPQIFSSATQQTYTVSAPQVITAQATNPQPNIQYVLQPTAMTSANENIETVRLEVQKANTITAPVYNTIVVNAPQVLASAITTRETLIENSSQITVPNSGQYTAETASQILNIRIVPNEATGGMTTRTVVVPTAGGNPITITVPPQSSNQMTHSIQSCSSLQPQVTNMSSLPGNDSTRQLHVELQSQPSESGK